MNSQKNVLLGTPPPPPSPAVSVKRASMRTAARPEGAAHHLVFQRGLVSGPQRGHRPHGQTPRVMQTHQRCSVRRQAQRQHAVLHTGSSGTRHFIFLYLLNKPSCTQAFQTPDILFFYIYSTRHPAHRHATFYSSTSRMQKPTSDSTPSCTQEFQAPDILFVYITYAETHQRQHAILHTGISGTRHFIRLHHVCRNPPATTRHPAHRHFRHQTFYSSTSRMQKHTSDNTPSCTQEFQARDILFVYITYTETRLWTAHKYT